MTSAQLLVTDNDFRDPDFRKQLNETVNSLLDLKVVPIFNENDAISTRRAPYEVLLLDFGSYSLIWAAFTYVLYVLPGHSSLSFYF